MVDLDELSPTERFAVKINLAMAEAIEDGADLPTVGKICINTARELYDHYGVAEDYNTFHEFVVDVGFETAEIEEWLDKLEEDRYDWDK